jgi:3-oxoacyl-[acyl-carrier protein] reductase
VVVTGASRGLGLGIARRLSRAGYEVIGIARHAAPAEAEREQEDAAGPVHLLPFDLARVEALPEMARDLRRRFGPLYGLVNNAGIGASGVLANMPDAQVAQLVQLNLVSPMLLSKHVVRGMMAQGEGRIVNIASIVAFTGYSGLAAYSATKAGLVGFTRSLAREVGRAGVLVNAVAPGFILTDLTGSLDAADRERIEQRSALRRLAQVEDVAAAVEFLLGEGARNITGTVLTVDAGNTA